MCFLSMCTDVERRRIYDIMNVLESLHMVSRSAKNRYAWHGRTKLAQTLAILKQVGEEHRYGQQMQQIRQRLLDKEFDFDGDEKENEEVDLESGEQGQKELFFVELPGVEFRAGGKLECCQNGCGFLVNPAFSLVLDFLKINLLQITDEFVFRLLLKYTVLINTACIIKVLSTLLNKSVNKRKHLNKCFYSVL